MIVSAILVCHDGERWLPTVLEGLASQSRPIDRLVAVDTHSSDRSVELVGAALGSENVVTAAAGTSFPEAVDRGTAALAAPADDSEWVWLLHDDATPAPDALEQLLAAAAAHPEADVLGPKLREWPSLRRLLELGLTISGTGHRETGLERGEYDQGQHDEVREVLAVNTAGMLVRRRVLEELGGLDKQLPIFGNDIDFGWRAARAGHHTLVVPQAVLFHAEAAHRGVRRTSLTGKHTHYQERRAALFTLLANSSGWRLPWQVVRLFFGSLLRALGYLLVRSAGEAADEVGALASVYARPGSVIAARRARAAAHDGEPADVRHLLAPAWVPYRHGLDFLSDLASAMTLHASDVAERRRAARQEAEPTPVATTRRPGHQGALEEDDEAFLEDTGVVARFLSNPVAVTLTVLVVLCLVAARAAFGSVVGGGLSPAPDAVGDWWQLHLESWHPLGTGSDVPAPAYVLPFSLAGTLLGGATGAVVSALMLLSVPVALWGAWRLLRVVGHLVDPRGLPRWLLVWGSATYALVPATSGAWGEGRFGIVAVAALLPWLGHAAIGFADPAADRRWRAAWRTALLLALAAAFVPAAWLFALLAAVLVLVAGALIAPSSLKDRSAWGPPVVALLAVPVLLAPWMVSLLTSGSAEGVLLEAGRLPVDRVDLAGLVTGRLGDLAAPWWLGGLVGLLAVVALVPRLTRVPVLACWLIGLAAAVVTALLSHVTLQLPAVTVRPSLGFFVVVLQGVAVVAATLGADAYLRRLQEHHPTWQRALAGLLAVVAAVVPLGGLGWWLVAADDRLDEPAAASAADTVPAYMEQSSLLGDEHGVLVVEGSVADGLDYRIRRGDGTTLGEDEVLFLTDEDTSFTSDVRSLASAPTPALVASLADRGIEYVVLPEPADGAVASGLDATAGLEQASAENRSTRAWKVSRELASDAVAGASSTWVRPLLLVLQGVAIVLGCVLAAPQLRRREEVRG